MIHECIHKPNRMDGWQVRDQISRKEFLFCQRCWNTHKQSSGWIVLQAPMVGFKKKKLVI